MFNKLMPGGKRILFAGSLATSIVVSAAIAQSAQSKEMTAGIPSRVSSRAALPSSKSVYTSASRRLTPGARNFYQFTWGVDIIGVKALSSGLMLRFSYRVVNAEMAKTLNDKRATPYLVDEKTGAKLEVPTMEKVGQLRQTGTPEVGREYWMVFANKGKFVKRGSHVDVVIGNFRANGLVVE